jgi:hypothetical protein
MFLLFLSAAAVTYRLAVYDSYCFSRPLARRVSYLHPRPQWNESRDLSDGVSKVCYFMKNPGYYLVYDLAFIFGVIFFIILLYKYYFIYR